MVTNTVTPNCQFLAFVRPGAVQKMVSREEDFLPISARRKLLRASHDCRDRPCKSAPHAGSSPTEFASGRAGTTLAISGGMMPPRTILAATDFSPASISGLAYAARLASYCRAALHVLHVEDPGPGAASEHHEIDVSDRTRREFQRV